MEENTLILLLGGALLVIAGLTFLLRPKRKERPLEAGGSRSKDRLSVLMGLKKSQPGFCAVLEAYLKDHSLDDLCRDREIAAALDELLHVRHTQGQDAARRSSHLQRLGLESAEITSRRYHPAMLTIVRGMYADADFAGGLSEELQQETDRLLENLTQ